MFVVHNVTQCKVKFFQDLLCSLTPYVHWPFISGQPERSIPTYVNFILFSIMREINFRVVKFNWSIPKNFLKLSQSLLCWPKTYFGFKWLNQDSTLHPLTSMFQVLLKLLFFLLKILLLQCFRVQIVITWKWIFLQFWLIVKRARTRTLFSWMEEKVN